MRSALRQRREVALDELAVVLVGDRRRAPRSPSPSRRRPRRGRRRPGRPGPSPRRRTRCPSRRRPPFASLIATQRRACHSAGSARPRTAYTREHCHSPRARLTGSPTRLAPVVARGMGAVDHLVVLGRRPVGLLEERPGVVEQVLGELRGGSPGRARGGVGGRSRGRVLRAELAEDVEDALEPEGAGLDRARWRRGARRRPGRRREYSRIVSSGTSRSRSRTIVRAFRAGRAGTAVAVNGSVRPAGAGRARRSAAGRRRSARSAARTARS